MHTRIYTLCRVFYYLMYTNNKTCVHMHKMQVHTHTMQVHTHTQHTNANRDTHTQQNPHA